MNKYLQIACLFLPIIVACSSDIVDGERTALLEAAEAYHTAASGKDAAAVVAMYDDNALMLPPNAPSVEGIENIRGYRFGFIETPGVELEFETVRARVSSSGDMGWTLAIGNITITRPDSAPDRDVVRDFHVWKKASDGSWKVVVDLWNSQPPPEELRN